MKMKTSLLRVVGLIAIPVVDPSPQIESGKSTQLQISGGASMIAPLYVGVPASGGTQVVSVPAFAGVPASGSTPNVPVPFVPGELVGDPHPAAMFRSATARPRTMMWERIGAADFPTKAASDR
jgi:hypothetical protein